MKRGCTFKKEQRKDAELLLTLHFAFFVLHWRKLVSSNFGLLESVCGMKSWTMSDITHHCILPGAQCLTYSMSSSEGKCFTEWL